ncbi:DUF4349 domain-containing protein [Nocardiopsis sp. NPDC006938]|uniref:DUF4349 domain-containing protein n=1 Tax=Nocardiopsis sp. NPDC006938 TaxID=3364337 RepID=UPI00368FE5F7
MTPSRGARTTGLAVASGLAVLLLASCGASSNSGAVPDSVGAAAPERQAVAESGAEFSAEGAAADTDPAEGGSVGSEVEVGERQLVHTADMTVRVDDVAEASDLAKRHTLDLGGYVESESLSTPRDDHPEGLLTLRVPSEDYEDALEELAALGDRSMLDRNVLDVTEEVADVESRVASSETAVETLRGYLEQAEDVDDLLRVESELQRRQEELEALQARQRVLENQTSFSTVRLTLQPPATYLEEPVRDSVGFLGGLERGWRALVGLGQGLAVAAGWLLPFAVVVAVLGAWPLWVWRGRRRARRAESAEPVTSGTEPVPETKGREESEEAAPEDGPEESPQDASERP